MRKHIKNTLNDFKQVICFPLRAHSKRLTKENLTCHASFPLNPMRCATLNMFGCRKKVGLPQMGLGYFSTNVNGGINSLCDFTKARSDIEAQGIERFSEYAHKEAVSR